MCIGNMLLAISLALLLWPTAVQAGAGDVGEPAMVVWDFCHQQLPPTHGKQQENHPQRDLLLQCIERGARVCGVDFEERLYGHERQQQQEEEGQKGGASRSFIERDTGYLVMPPASAQECALILARHRDSWVMAPPAVDVDCTSERMRGEEGSPPQILIRSPLHGTTVVSDAVGVSYSVTPQCVSSSAKVEGEASIGGGGRSSTTALLVCLDHVRLDPRVALNDHVQVANSGRDQEHEYEHEQRVRNCWMSEASTATMEDSIWLELDPGFSYSIRLSLYANEDGDESDGVSNGSNEEVTAGRTALSTTPNVIVSVAQECQRAEAIESDKREDEEAASPAPRLFDCFIFFDELELLEIRLHELHEAVDVFVIAEASETFQGQPKPLHLKERLLAKDPRFLPFLDKLFLVHVPPLPSPSLSSGAGAAPASDGEEGRGQANGEEEGVGTSHSSFSAEIYQREALVRGLAQAGVRRVDYVKFGDVDEIPTLGALHMLKGCINVQLPIVFHQDFHYYSFHWRKRATIENYHLTQASLLSAVRLSVLRGTGYSKTFPVDVARDVSGVLPVARLTNGAGWHCSYFGGVQSIIRKIESFSHDELNRGEFKDPASITLRVHSGEDLFGRGGVDEMDFVAAPTVPRLVASESALGEGRFLYMAPHCRGFTGNPPVCISDKHREGKA